MLLSSFIGNTQSDHNDEHFNVNEYFFKVLGDRGSHCS